MKRFSRTEDKVQGHRETNALFGGGLHFNGVASSSLVVPTPQKAGSLALKKKLLTAIY